MTIIGTFPFGQPVLPVVQRDRCPKKVFILGVYASAVHARWLGPDGAEVVKALAVASEPYIFWHGDKKEAEAIIGRIPVPKELGTLEPARDEFNGPSGKVLDEQFLAPLKFKRADAWLCDLVSHSCVNPQQQVAIERAYMPVAPRHGLPMPSVPTVPSSLADDARRKAILDELRESQAPMLVLLGDQPIKWFLRHFDPRWNRLADFQIYGQRHQVKLDGLAIELVPLCHPRQAGRLGRASENWPKMHEEWVEKRR